jgi:hypothetical protein
MIITDQGGADGPIAAARPAAVDAKIDTKTSRLICAAIGLQLQRELNSDETVLPRRLALLLDKIQRADAET